MFLLLVTLSNAEDAPPAPPCLDEAELQRLILERRKAGAPTGELPDTCPKPTPPPTGAHAGSRVIHWSEAQIRTRPAITASDFPDGVETGEAQTCVLRLYVDPRGNPYLALPRRCPAAFVEHAQAIAMRYRFYPVKIDGGAADVEFDLTIRFASKG